MVYTYTPTYYSNYTSLQDSIATICKTIILPFSFKKRPRRLPAFAAAEQRLSKHQSDNLKWQQDSFHHILNLMGLSKECIVSENEVSSFKTHLLETLIASPIDHEPPLILRDKLIFLQELLFAKCVSEEEYHASKRPLLQRLAVQGAEIDARDMIVGAQKETSNEEWSVIELKDDKCSANQEMSSSTSTKNTKQSSAVKKMKGGAASVFSFVSSDKNKKSKESNGHNNEGCKSIFTRDRKELGCSTENPFWNSHLNDSKTILMVESLPLPRAMPKKTQSLSDKTKRKQFTTVIQREQEGCDGDISSGNDSGQDLEKEKVKSAKKAWAFDGFKKWKKNDETSLLFVDEKPDGESYVGKLVANPVGEGPDTKQIKRKLHPNGAPTDFFVDKVLGEKIKRELCRYPNVHLSDDQIEVISTRLPVDKADLQKFFPKSWCDEYGDIVLDVVRKEFKEHMREIGHSRQSKPVEKQNTLFDDENLHPNLFAPQEHVMQASFSSSNNIGMPVVNSSIDKGFKYNPFFDV